MCVRLGCRTVLQDLREVVGSVVRNGPIGQRLQEAQHWHGLRVLGALDLLALTDDDRRTHFSGSLGRQHIRRQMKFTMRRLPLPTHTGCLVPGSGKYSFSAYRSEGSSFMPSVEQLSPLSSVSLSVFYLQSPLINRTSLLTCALNIPLPAPQSSKGDSIRNELFVFLFIRAKCPHLYDVCAYFGPQTACRSFTPLCECCVYEETL